MDEMTINNELDTNYLHQRLHTIASTLCIGVSMGSHDGPDQIAGFM